MKKLLCIALLLPLAAFAADLPEPPKDWLKQAELFGAVSANKDDAAIIAWERAHQLDLSSGYLFDLSRRLFASHTDEALEWYAVALIRGQYDAGRCIDDTARRAVSKLSGIAEGVARYGHNRPHELGAAGLRALGRADLLAHTVSPDWICAQALSGMGARSAGTTPPARWPALEHKLRQDFARQFEAMTNR
jgi:hypothetical protein